MLDRMPREGDRDIMGGHWLNYGPEGRAASESNAPWVRWSVRVEVVVSEATKGDVRALIGRNFVDDHFGMDEGTGMISAPLIGVVFGVVARSVGEAAQNGSEKVLRAAELASDALYGVTVVSDTIVDEWVPRDYPHLLD